MSVSDAILEMCSLFEEGQVVDLAAEHAAQVARVKSSLAELRDATLKQKFTDYSARWTAASIKANPGAFYDQTQVLAADLGDAGLLT
jgi:hypothetical protein